MAAKRVAIIMGSDSDMAIACAAAKVLDSFKVPYAMRIMSAHRTPDAVHEFATGAADDGFAAVIAIAGKAAHLAGVIASETLLPVIGVPVGSAEVGGLDALLSTVQMPAGVPVATVAINNAANAAWLALRILALMDAGIAEALEARRREMASSIVEKDRKLQEELLRKAE